MSVSSSFRAVSSRFLVLAPIVPSLAACGDSFTEQSAVRVGVNFLAGLPTAMTHADSDTVSVEVVDSLKRRLVGVLGAWRSSDDAKLHVRPLGSDSLRAILTASGIGSAQITVSIDTGIGKSVRYDSAKASVTVMERWIAVSAGQRHTCGINVDSTAYCWGGAGGQIGNGTQDGSPTPVRVLGLGAQKLVQISAGDSVSCTRERRGLLFCWGANGHGEVGNGSLFPQYQATVGGGGELFTFVKVGGHFVCGIASGINGGPRCWGEASLAQLGIPILPNLVPCDIQPDPTSPLPTRECTLGPTKSVSDGFNALGADEVSAGGVHGCLVKIFFLDTGRILCWGLWTVGQIGADTTTSGPSPGLGACIPGPVGLGFPCAQVAEQINSLLRFTFVSAGWDDNFESHTCALTVDSLAYCWGKNQEGQLGSTVSDPTLCVWNANTFPVASGSPKCSHNPIAVDTRTKFSTIGAGAHHTCALGALDSLAYCWGDNSQGQLGNGATGGTRSDPAPVAGQTPLRFIALTVGGNHTCGIAKGGALYCWGKGDDGQLGTSPAARGPKPVRIAEPST